jgi:hypothetical protein
MAGFTRLFDTACDHTSQFTVTHTLVSTVTSSLPLLGSGFPNSGFPSCRRPHGNSSHQLTHSLTHQRTVPHFTKCPVYNISARTAHKTPYLIFVVQLLLWEHVCLRSRYSVRAVVYLLISRSLTSNGSAYHNSKMNHMTSHSWLIFPLLFSGFNVTFFRLYFQGSLYKNGWVELTLLRIRTNFGLC